MILLLMTHLCQNVRQKHLFTECYLELKCLEEVTSGSEFDSIYTLRYYQHLLLI